VVAPQRQNMLFLSYAYHPSLAYLTRSIPNSLLSLSSGTELELTDHLVTSLFVDAFLIVGAEKTWKRPSSSGPPPILCQPTWFLAQHGKS